jgi:tetratricopeptide (TPR) repeat protein
MTKKRKRIDQKADSLRPKNTDEPERPAPALKILILSNLAVFVFLIYSNALTVPFVYDDFSNIHDNPHIRLTSLSAENIARVGLECLSSLRPVANLSFALNYYFHQYDVIGYHLVNILIHIVTGLLLYLFIKITLDVSSVRSQSRTFRWLPVIVTAIWLVHPLHTQSVTYIVQRMNAMATMFYILAFLLYIKGRLAGERKMKFVLFGGCIVAGILSIGSKEISATLPFFIFLYEWYFFQDLKWSWLKRHILKFAGLLIFLALCIFLIMGSDLVEQMLKGYEVYDFTPIERVLTEFRVVIYYISLLFFPHPSRLNLDHDFSISHSLFDPITTLLSIGIIAGLIGFAFYIAKKDRLLSFCILWFFGNLVIESSVIGLELIYEHRTYLPSMLLCLMVVLLVYQFKISKKLSLIIVCAVVVTFSFWTYKRNATWGDGVTLWRDSVQKSPKKARPYLNLGFALHGQEKIEEAIKYYQEGLRIKPNYEKAHNNLGVALRDLGRLDEAIPHYLEALRIKPDYAEAHNNLGVALKDQGKLEEASGQHFEALRIKPDYPEAHNNLGVALKDQGSFKEAGNHFLEALRINPNYAEPHYNLANALATQKLFKEAVQHYFEALRIKPDYAKAHHNLGLAMASQGKINEAIRHYIEALRINPNYADAHYNLAKALTLKGKVREATNHYNEALKIRPEDPHIHFNRALILARQGRLNEALKHYSETLRMEPNYAEAHNNMGVVFARMGNLNKAEDHYAQAILINPDYAEAHNNMGVVLARQGKLVEASKQFSEALRIDPEDGEAHFNLGNALADLGKIEQALNHYSEALRIKPDDEEARRHRERILRLLGDSPG